MSGDNKGIRLAKVALEINVGIETIVEHLRKKGHVVENRPTTKISDELYDLLLKDFRSDKSVKQKAEQINLRPKREEKSSAPEHDEVALPIIDTPLPPVVDTNIVLPPPVKEKKIELDSAKIEDNTQQVILPPPNLVTTKEEVVDKNMSSPLPIHKEEALPILDEPIAKKENALSVEETKEAQTVEEKVPVVKKQEQRSKSKQPKEESAIEGEGQQDVPEQTIKIDKDTDIKKTVEREVVPVALDQVSIEGDSSTPLPAQEDKKVSGSVKNKSKNTAFIGGDNNEDSTTVVDEPDGVLVGPKVVGKIDLDNLDQRVRPDKKKEKRKRRKERERAKKERERLEKGTDEATTNTPPAEADKAKQNSRVNKDNKTDMPAIGNNKSGRGGKDMPRNKPAQEVVQPIAEITKDKKEPPVEKVEPELIRMATPQLQGLKILGKIDIKPAQDDSQDANKKKKRKRKRIVKDKNVTPTAEEGAKPAAVPRDREKDKERGNRENRDGRTKTDGKDRRRENTSGGSGGTGGSGGGGGGVNTGNNNRGNRTDNKTGGGDRRRVDRHGGGDKHIEKLQTNEVSDKEIKEKIRETMALLSGEKAKNQRSKLRRQKRDIMAERREAEDAAASAKVLHVTEFVSVSEIAKLMDVSVPQIISTCMNLGMMVTINYRMDAELIEIVANEFGFEVQFVGATEDTEAEAEEVDNPEDLSPRPPIVTIMGHVDHGKTSLLDYIRRANVVAGEVGGITQHIGAYSVTLPDKREITFLDTPGHEAFTSMRARGAKVTDIAVIVIAADDSVMQQTKEAISHAQAAGVPMIFAINKMDKPEANPERVREQLAQMNLLVEEWGGTYQSQEISAKKGINVTALLEKILLEADMLELKANPKRMANGTIIEASLDKGKGYMANVLVQNGTLSVGDPIISGQYYGRVKAMFNERGARVKTVGPSEPVMVLGLSGAPQAGEKIKAMASEQDVRSLALKREQIIREQQQRATKHITLEEIGRRLALGSFKELKLIIKGDVDGSVEALCDSLLKLSTPEIQVNVIFKAVGAITETDVMLASASDAIIIGFQVRPSAKARRQAENENIDIRMYSIIYKAVEDVKAAMEGMLEPHTEEKFVCNIEVRDVFKITKVGTVAGCLVQEGKVSRDTKIRIIRDGIVIHTGDIQALKRFKDEVKEVAHGLECGIFLKNFSDIRVGDYIEGYEEIEIKRKL